MKFTQLIDKVKQRVAGKWTGIEQMLRVPASMCHKQVAGVTKVSDEELYKAVQTPGTFSGRLIKISYVLRMQVKHGQFGQGPFVEVPIRVIPKMVLQSQDSCSSLQGWEALPTNESF